MRKVEISFMNTVCCLLVMFIHICSPVIGGAEKDSLLFAGVFFPWRASAFVVQCFLFLSALKFFCGKQQDFSYGKFLWSRVKKIGIPYAVATVFSYLVLIRLGYYYFDAGFLLSSLALGNMLSPFYFIVILFQFYLLMPFWRWMVEKIDFWLAAVGSILLMVLFHQHLPQMLALSGITFPYNDRVFTTYLAYWVLGCYAGKHYEAFCHGVRRHTGLILGGFMLFLLADTGLMYGAARGLLQVAFLEDVHTLYVFSAILACAWFGLYFGEKFFRLPLLKGIDGLSFYIYLYHGIWLYVVQDRLLTPLGIGLASGWAARLVLCWGGAFAAAAIWKIWKRKKVG